ncbi:glycosyltransferase [Spirosoma utsteinense]|uniref:Glycosyltransferase involved in cell wall biosynthesis n=1 Tax=Spirosoma utsteinense TaxID=2585773 RepID=A0ABR6WDI3_9BACT|nr:glycosyltransferase [Spirosoma utsteinense]MBC3788551.1 glycosyltransferase involved in cell wall biosynthesis [Spirosoma utsteinense]MBC3794558.1 glycosyltransferase involved in cell wall biosynthesis [Spirosoma utsteinense]
MRILHVAAEIDPETGGVSQAVRTMINGLTNEGVHNEVVSVDAPDAPFIKTDPFTIHALGPRNGQWGYNSKLISWLVDNAARFDVIILHGLWLYPGYALRRAMKIVRNKQSKGKQPKFFVMPHGMLDPWFQKASTRKIKALRNWAYWKLIERNIIADADGLLFTCEAEQLLAREPFRPYKPKNEAVVGLGVDEPPVYTPAMRESFLKKCPDVTDAPYVLFLSRIHEKKGVDLLIDTYSQLLKSYSALESEVYAGESGTVGPEKMNLPKLVIAGPGLETPYGQKMQQQVAQQQDLAALISFPGMLTDDAKWGAFYGCEAFILPSHQENFGIAVVEALSCGKPVLISDQVNIWREIGTAGGGLVAADSPEGTEQMLEGWLRLSDEQKRAIEQQTRKAYRTYFAVEPATKNLLLAIA